MDTVAAICGGIFLGSLLGYLMSYRQRMYSGTNPPPVPKRKGEPPYIPPMPRGQEMPCTMAKYRFDGPLDTIQALVLLGEDVLIDYPEHDRHDQVGKLITASTHSWTWDHGLKRDEKFTVVFPGGLEHKFLARHIKPI